MPRIVDFSKPVLICILIGMLLAAPGMQPGQPVVLAQTQELCTQPHQDVALPLTDLGIGTYSRPGGQPTSQTGGLYPDGSNLRPAAHEAAGVRLARQIQPLDAQGNPDRANGKMVMISVGMSNTWMEFEGFKRAIALEPNFSPKAALINGAEPSMVSSYWVDPNAATWQELDARLAAAGLTPEQVQAAWVKLTQTGHGEYPTKPRSLETELRVIVRNLRTNYPNIKIAYVSSRSRSYLYDSGLSPEPDAYETGFAVKWMIEGQINGDSDLNYDPDRGDVVAPYLSWGPYLWIDGMNPRSDGYRWTADDLVVDCTHPSHAGVAKIAEIMLSFFRSDSISFWLWRGVLDFDLRWYLPWIVFFPRVY